MKRSVRRTRSDSLRLCALVCCIVTAPLAFATDKPMAKGGGAIPLSKSDDDTWRNQIEYRLSWVQKEMRDVFRVAMDHLERKKTETPAVKPKRMDGKATT